MIEKDNSPVKVEITQDKLVDLLLHAATREDIAKYAADNKADIQKVETALKADMVKYAADNKADIQKTEALLKADIQRVENSLENKIQRVETQIRWVLGTVIGVGVSICGVMIGLASFLTHYIR